HGASFRFVWRLAEDEAISLGHGVGGEDDGSGRAGTSTTPNRGSTLELADYGGRFAIRKFGEAGRTGFATDAAFHVLVGRHYLEMVAGLRQQLAAARRATGEDKGLGTRGWGLGMLHHHRYSIVKLS
ncbi:MAG: hypothetical protein WD229_02575, partial [Pirellulales bacterium]